MANTNYKYVYKELHDCLKIMRTSDRRVVVLKGECVGQFQEDMEAIKDLWKEYGGKPHPKGEFKSITDHIQALLERYYSRVEAQQESVA